MYIYIDIFYILYIYTVYMHDSPFPSLSLYKQQANKDKIRNRNHWCVTYSLKDDHINKSLSGIIISITTNTYSPRIMQINE